MTNSIEIHWKFYVIGCGGIGSYLIPPLLRYLNSTWPQKAEITFIDGDVIHEHNLNRQNFFEDHLGMNKASAFAEEYCNIFNNIDINYRMTYIDKTTVQEFKDNSFIFMCVDNHNTRKLVNDHCQKLKNVVLISGGNEIDEGNIQAYIRLKNEDITNPITKFHPEIKNPTDRNPAEMSCEELSEIGSPQVIMTNFMVAALMLNAFYTILNHSKTVYNEVNFNIVRNIAKPDFSEKQEMPTKLIYQKNQLKFRKVKVKENGEMILTLVGLSNIEQSEFQEKLVYDNRIIIGSKTKNKRDLDIKFQEDNNQLLN